MMQTKDLSTATRLAGEARMLQRAVEAINQGALVNGVSLAPKGDDPQTAHAMPVQLPIADLPPQVTAQIKQRIEARLKAVNDELAKLGITN
jgi:hypothetical protein